MNLWMDCETFSETPINAGTYRYAQDCEVMLITWAIDDGPASCIDLTAGEVIPAELEAAFEDEDGTITAHNAMFDRNVLRYALGIDIPIKRWRCTMVKAMAHSLPGSLETLCQILKLPVEQTKLDGGKQLVQLFCKPRPKNAKLRRATRETHPNEWARFIEYAKLDIEAMRAIDKKLPNWNYEGFELDLWHLDQKINDRGFQADTKLAQAAIEAVNQAQAGLRDQCFDMTEGTVSSATKRDALLEYVLSAYGVGLPDMQMSTLENRMNDPDLPQELKDLLGVRLQATTSSTAKYKKLIKAVNDDGRLRGTLQFCGALRTGRWGGRTFQPQNLARPTLKQDEIDVGIKALTMGAAGYVYDNVMEIASNGIRGCIIAAPGKKLVISDLANIEGRVAAWLAGEQWKLEAFRAYDAGTGPDLYNLAYANAFKIDIDDVAKEQRQIGKTMELACAYGGGTGAYLTFATAFRIDLDEMTRKVWSTLDSRITEEASNFYKWAVAQKRNTFGLPEKIFITCDALKRIWRENNAMIASYWRTLNRAIVAAYDQPGKTIDCRLVKIRRDGAWMRIKLPSGRSLCYPSFNIDDKEKMSFMGVNQYSRQWSRIGTYSEKVYENICQAVARDVMAWAMPRIEAAEYEIVLSVHDELITEPWNNKDFSEAELSALLAAGEVWTEGLPLAAAGFETYRYRKDQS